MDEIKQILTDLEKIAEPSFGELKTTEYIVKFLDENNIPIDKVLKTGCFGTINAGYKRTIGFRADIDALPLSSENKKFAHLCGHHAHTTGLLMALKEINRNKSKLKANIRYIFQPAEENGKGAVFMIENGAIENIDEIYGLHGDPNYKIGELCLKKGWVMAGSCLFKIIISGRSTHAAFPHKGDDVIMAIAEYINLTQKIISRMKDPTKEALISFCIVNGGYASNILPEEVYSSGTFRFFHNNEKQLIANKMKEILKSIENIYNVKGKIIFDFATKPVNNNKKLTEKLLKIFSLQNDITIIENHDLLMGSEDFSEFTSEIPGVYMKVGIAESNNHPPLHNKNFYVPAKATEIYIKVWKQLAYSIN